MDPLKIKEINKNLFPPPTLFFIRKNIIPKKIICDTCHLKFTRFFVFKSLKLQHLATASSASFSGGSVEETIMSTQFLVPHFQHKNTQHVEKEMFVIKCSSQNFLDNILKQKCSKKNFLNKMLINLTTNKI